MSKTVVRRSLAVVGAAALVFGVAADVTVADASPAGGHSGRAPFATRAESLRLARKLLAKAVLPPGARRFNGRKLPAALTAPPQETAATPLVDAHRVFTERSSMRRTARFLAHHDIEVVWYRHKPASDYLVARHFRAVRINDFGNGPHSPHRARTFRQRAIIDKLTRVLNADPVAPGGFWNCPEYGPSNDGRTVRLIFVPVKGRPGAVVTAYFCPPGYEMSIGGHSQPTLAGNGKIEKIADKLLRGSRKPSR